MRTRNNKNNLSQSKTNNDNNYFSNKNDINAYLNKYIFNKKKTRTRNNYIFLNKNTFNLSSQKSDINGSINGSNNTYLNNHIKNINYNKNFFMKSRNKIPSRFKGRPNTIFSNNNNLINNKQKKKILINEKKEINSNGIVKKRNYSMVGCSNVININLNNNNQNLTEREIHKIMKSKIENKSPVSNFKKIKHNHVLSGIHINLSNLENLSKKEINSEREKVENKNNRKISQNKTNNGITSIIQNNNGIYKSKLSFMSSHSVSKSKSKSKSKNKTKISQHFKKARIKSMISNSLKNTLIEDISKWKKIGKKPNIIAENKNLKKLSKNMDLKQKLNNDQKYNFNNSNYINNNMIIMNNNNEQTPGAMTSRTRNLKTFNILFKTNSIEMEKNKINYDINNYNNKENYSLNRKENNNIMNNSNCNGKNNIYFINLNKCKRNSFGNHLKNNYIKKVYQKKISKNNTEKNLLDNNVLFSNGFQKFIKSNIKALKNK